MSKIISFTGHRPNKLDNDYEYTKPISRRILAHMRQQLREHQATHVISGGALGIDTLAAMAAVMEGIPFTLAMPFENQDAAWAPSSKARFKRMRELAAKVVVVSSGEYNAQKMQIRNRWMVDNSDVLFAYFDGTSGGTMNCVQYARSIKHEIHQFNPHNI